MKTSTLRFFDLVLVSIVMMLVVACGGAATPTEVAQTVEPTAPPTIPPPPMVQLVPAEGPVENREIFKEERVQNNCGATLDISNTIERSQSIAYTMEVGGGITLNSEGKISGGLPAEVLNAEVSVGTAVQATYGVSYGKVDTLADSLILPTEKGAHRKFVIQHLERWEHGELVITIAGKELRYPYSFRRGFALQQASSEDLGCPTTPTPTPVPTDTSTPTTVPTDPPTHTPIPTDTPTNTPVPTDTPTNTPVPTDTPIPTPTNTATKENTAADSGDSSGEKPVVDKNWQGEYFDNEDFTGKATYTREDEVISFDWQDTNPVPGVGKDDFSVRWTRCLEFEERYYTFSGKADWRMVAYLDETELFQASYGSNSQKYLVTAGEHCLKLEYRAGSGDSSVSFEFKSDEKPASSSPSDASWQGEYFDNEDFTGQPAYTREDAVISFDWQDTNPVPGVGKDDFSVRWTRCLEFEERYYTFSGKADWRMVAYLDDTELFQTSYGSKSQKYLVAAGQHCLKLEYRAGSGDSSVSFEFKAN